METRNVENGIVFHLHLDEILAYLLAKTFGQGRLIGIENAPHIISTSIPKKNPAYWAGRHQWVIGDGGDWTDEYVDSKTRARQEGASATSKTIELLGIKEPTFEKIAAEVTHFDRTRKCPKGHLGTLLKIIKTNRKNGDEVALDWAYKVLGCVYYTLAKNLPSPAREKRFLVFLSDIVATTKKKENWTDDVHESVLNILTKENESGYLLGLKGIYQGLWRGSNIQNIEERKNSIYEDMSLVVGLLGKDQMNFHAMLALLDGRKLSSDDFRSFDVPYIGGDGKGQSFRAAVIRTDNPAAHGALRRRGFMVTAVISSKGNVSIQGDQDKAGKKGLMSTFDHGITELGAILRYMDASFADKKRANWDILTWRGNCPGDEYWYIHDEGWLSVSNGTHYHAAKSTTIDITGLRSAITNAFHPGLLGQWKRIKGILVEKKNPSVSKRWTRPPAAASPEVQDLVNSAFGRPHTRN